jgi:hypothetical protein
MIDPPSGWMYGFPKELPDPPPEDYQAWMIQEGYPAELIESLGQYFFVRMWSEAE